MSKLGDVGSLMYLYMDYIKPIKTEQFSSFLVTATAQCLKAYGDRNWQPLLVKEVGENQYEILGNEFIYAVAKTAGFDRLWCIIADDKPETAEIIQILTQNKPAKINLCLATKEEIKLALEYLATQPNKPLRGVIISKAVTTIGMADRKNWKSFNEIPQLKCGITTPKLDCLNQVFYVLPELKIEPIAISKPEPENQPVEDERNLSKLTMSELKAIAKQRKLKNFSKLNKAALLKLLNERTLEDFLI